MKDVLGFPLALLAGGAHPVQPASVSDAFRMLGSGEAFGTGAGGVAALLPDLAAANTPTEINQVGRKGERSSSWNNSTFPTPRSIFLHLFPCPAPSLHCARRPDWTD